MRLVLASASPRRADLLRAAGFTFDTVPAEVDERVRDGELPGQYVRRLAAEKSAAVLEALTATGSTPISWTADLVVLGADTTVVVDGEILGKPRDDREAGAMLRRLSGRRHEVLTGVSLRSRSAERGLVETTGVYMLKLRDQDIAWYLGSREGRDKAGAYGIQGLASRFIPRIDGSYANVVGLPVANIPALLHALASAG
jgi:nucleoside triphosphate pyrophosphatase